MPIKVDDDKDRNCERVRERQFDIDGLCIHAREWGEQGLPVLALHGWLDNAASFDALAEQLTDYHLLAIDLPGHGLSDNKPAHATYHIWDDLLIILAVADAMAWDRFVLLGHSRGAIMSVLLTSGCPERISALVCLDGLVPGPVPIEETHLQLGKFLKDYRSLGERRTRVFQSLDDIVAARQRVMPMSEAAARKITERAARQSEQGYIWNSDPRLKAASAFKLSEAHLRVILSSLQVPLLLVLAEEGFARYSQLLELLPNIDGCTVERLPGSHHFHMEEAAGNIAALIRKFLSAPGIASGIAPDAGDNTR